MTVRHLRAAEPTPLQVGAYQAGRAAFVDGAPSTACPFVAAEVRDEELLTLWIRGWVHARTEARYGGDDPTVRHPSLTRLERG